MGGARRAGRAGVLATGLGLGLGIAIIGGGAGTASAEPAGGGGAAASPRAEPSARPQRGGQHARRVEAPARKPARAMVDRGDTVRSAVLSPVLSPAPSPSPSPAAALPARPAKPAADAGAGRRSGFFAGLAALFNNQAPSLAPSQTGQGANGVVTGELNAVDPDSEHLTFTVQSQPAHGTAEVSADGTWTYIPVAAVAATGVIDSFSVTVSDAAGRGLAGLVHLLSFGMLGSRAHSTTATVGVVVAPFVPDDEQSALDHRQEMRDFVIAIAEQARSVNPGFIVIPQNGQELLTLNGAADGPLAAEYAAAISGQGREDLFYGYNSDNTATPAADRDYMLGFLDRDEAEGVQVLVTDYCSTAAFVNSSYTRNAEHGFISFAANHRELDTVPPRPAVPFEVNADDVETLAQARNFLYLLNPGRFASRQSYLDTLAATDYDVMIIDAFYEDEALSAADVAALQTKANGGRRLVLAYMSIGEAEDYRYYWQPGWRAEAPSWLDAENPDFAGNYKVRYWDQAWQDVILNGPDAYLNRITAAGFDGVYLDLIDAFEYYE